jgi:hypothetical protein
MTDLHFLTIAQASALIKAQKLSPVELTQAFLARIQELDARLNSHLLVLEDQAMADAERAETEIAAGGWKGPLHGIPIGLKDIYNTAGIRTTGHSALFADHVPTEDAFTVSLLRKAGAVITSKLATWEFAIGGSSFDLPWPPARNLRIGRRRRRRFVHGRDGQRHRRIDPRPGCLVWHRRPQADLWPAEPARHPAAVVLAGSRRPDVLDQ